MRVVFINASPKEGGSLSSLLIEKMIPYIRGHQYGVLNVREDMDRHMAVQVLNMADAIVVVSPVSFGSLPSRLLGLFSETEMHMHDGGIPVCAIVHGDLYETDDVCSSMEVIKRWCERAHLEWITGIGAAGADGFLTGTGSFPHRWNSALKNMAQALVDKNGISEEIFSIGIRMFYKHTMEQSHRRRIHDNGLETRDMNSRITDSTLQDIFEIETETENGSEQNG